MKSWLPWQYLLRRVARRRGFIDPIEFLARLRRFAQPSEVQEPIELVRAGVVFHARGLINTKVFQYHLDWIWPYWVVRQFDPADPSFLPRAFSFSHVNLTHRNWTAIGLPGMDEYPIVDPRGLVTLPVDPWSLDWWFLPDNGAPLHPSRQAQAEQRLEFARGLEVVTRCEQSGVVLETAARVEAATVDDRSPRLVVGAWVRAATDGRLVLAARPANPEGIHFVERIAFHEAGWRINGRHDLCIEGPATGMFASTYARGDVVDRLDTGAAAGAEIHCPAGLATAAATFRVRAGEPLTVRAGVELARATGSATTARTREQISSWEAALAGVPQLDVPVSRWRFLHTAALRTIVLLSPGEIFPGPSTYRRFWFRDACLIMNALLAANCDERVRVALDGFPARQHIDGYFHSQEGEWDANGQVLWIADRYERCTHQHLPESFLPAIRRGGDWIGRKRKRAGAGGHPGLLPPGFSAEHLGPVAQYYWDDFWGVAGLRAAANLVARHHDDAAAARLREEAEAFARDVRSSLKMLPPSVVQAGVPASPHRRMDAGAIGSMVADYPLQLDDVVSQADTLRTAEWLWRHCRFQDGFFQDMIHSGINAYLTLALAQTFMRNGDDRHRGLVDAVAALASPTGQWPEAIHPRTLGGCMGDGQHAWAAAEWILAVRAMFVREESQNLVVGAGLRPEWFKEAERLAYGPTNTKWGRVTVALENENAGWALHLGGTWHGPVPPIWIAIPGFVAGWADLVDGVAPLRPEPPPAEDLRQPSSNDSPPSM